MNDPLFDGLPQIHIAQLLQFVDRRCYCLDAFTNILGRYVKTTLDRQSIVACLIAYGTNNAAGLTAVPRSSSRPAGTITISKSVPARSAAHCRPLR